VIMDTDPKNLFSRLIRGIIDQLRRDTMKIGRYVAISGGLGGRVMAQAMREYVREMSILTAVTDSGRSTQVIRELSGIPGPGDTRNVLFDLSALFHPDPYIRALANFLQLRPEFPNSNFNDMPTGNFLFGVAGQKDPDHKISSLVEVLNRVFLPSGIEVWNISDAATHLVAELEDGTKVFGEVNVRAQNKPRIVRAWLEDESACITDQANVRLKNADLITIGPGSLITTQVADILFRGLRESLEKTQGKVVVVSNTTTQPGQTDRFTFYDHIEWLVRVLGRSCIDAVIVNTATPNPTVQERAERLGMEPLLPKSGEIQAVEQDFNVRVFPGDMIEEDGFSRDTGSKQDCIRHRTPMVGEFLNHVYRTLCKA